MTGESGADLTTVSGQSGYYANIVRYIADAWEEIQVLHSDWRFLRKSALPTIAASENSVDVDAWVFANLATNIDFIHKNTFSIYLTATGISDETKLTYVPWEHWKENFGILYADGVVNRPTHVTLDPDTDTLIVGPTSNAAYTIAFEFNEIPVVLTTSANEPSIISALQKVIVGRALEMYGEEEESSALMKKGNKLYKRYLSRLRIRELPRISIGGPLA